MELGSHSWMDCLAAKLFLNSCFSADTVFVTLFRTAVETAVSGVHRLLRTGGVLIALILFWRWLTVSSGVFLRVDAQAGPATHRYPSPPPPSFPSPFPRP